MNTYQTASMATGVARTLSKHGSCTIVVYKTSDCKFVTARTNDPVRGLVQAVYREGYLMPTQWGRAA